MRQKKGTLKPKPYARLITMIGEQLIRNETIALMELIKNSYDADASWVKIRFKNFDEKGNIVNVRNDSIIEVEDDGVGMDFDVIEDAWMNPASPHKYLKRKKGKDRTEKGRVMQGEKGIGRFAVFKIGNTMEIFTRAKNTKEEISLKGDLSIYDEDLLKIKGSKSDKPLFLDDVRYKYEIRDELQNISERDITIFGESKKRAPHGTLIRISNLKGKWTKDKIYKVFTDSLKMVSPFNKIEFSVDITLNRETIYSVDEKDRLEEILENAPIHMKGEMLKEGSCKFVINKKEEIRTLKQLSEIKDIKDHFFEKGEQRRVPECGPFRFEFYVFDLKKAGDLSSALRKDDRGIIKSHRIYLYRDGIRVYPYGDQSDDWVGIDIKRGIQRAGEYLSNDQTIGYVEITNKNNPDLKDKTNREGLMDIGYAFEDLKVLILGLLGILLIEFRRYKNEKEIKKLENKKKKGLFIEEAKVEKDLVDLFKHLKEIEDDKGKKIHQKIEKDYKEVKGVLTRRAEVVEDLAAVGMTVDAASHDLVIMMGRAKETLNLLVKIGEADSIDNKTLRDNLEKLRGQFAFIEDQLHGIQPLFRSSRRRSGKHRISDIIKKILLYYSVPVEEIKITVEIKNVNGSPLIIECPEAILLQTFMNLMDNAIYWLQTSDRKKKKISVLIDGTKCEVVFADNGTGVREDDIDYIFRPFFSTKGIQGRGLGLYIARQLLERYDYEIDYILKNKLKILSGANFLVNFVGIEEKEKE